MLCVCQIVQSIDSLSSLVAMSVAAVLDLVDSSRRYILPRKIHSNLKTSGGFDALI